MILQTPKQSQSDLKESRIRALQEEAKTFVPKKGKEGKVYGEANYKTLMSGCRYWLKCEIDAVLIKEKQREDVDLVIAEIGRFK